MSAPDPGVRIADSDRERAMADLAMHYADGRLDHEEYDERLDAIWTARTRADLAVLFSDLPRPQVTDPKVRTPQQKSGRRKRVPLLPVLALLIALSMIIEAPLWLLIFPLMFVNGRHGGSCAPPHGHADYRRSGRSHGW